MPTTETTTQTGRVVIETVEELQRLNAWVAEGDSLRTGARTNWLTVTGTHEREREKKATYRPNCRDTIELSGNGTAYHILQSEPEGDIGPMLYPEASWEETPDGINSYTYPRSGERVKQIELGTHYARSPATGAWYRLYEWDDLGDGKLQATEKEQVDRSEVPIAWLDAQCFEYDDRLKRWGEITEALGVSAYRDGIRGVEIKETDDLEIGGVNRAVVAFKTEQAVEEVMSQLDDRAEMNKDSGCFSEAEDLIDFRVALREWYRNEADFGGDRNE